MFFNASDYEPRIVLTLFLTTEVETSPENFKSAFKSLLMFYYIIKLSKTSYFASTKQ